MDGDRRRDPRLRLRPRRCRSRADLLRRLQGEAHRGAGEDREDAGVKRERSEAGVSFYGADTR